MLKALLKRDPVQRSHTKCVRKFLHYFTNGYPDPKYIAWERGYKEDAHKAFHESLNKEAYRALLKAKQYEEIAMIAVRIESKTNLLFSFEKMALRDAVKTKEGAEAFATGLFDYIYGEATLKERFESFTQMLGDLPRKQTRVLTWPLQTVFGFIANPQEHIFLKPRVTQIAAEKYKYDFQYKSRPNWNTYLSLLGFAEQIRKDTAPWEPKDYIDLQSFMWVIGSDEYPD